MAQKVVTTYVDDLTGEESEEISTHTVLIDGAGVELDLSPQNYDQLLEALSPYLNAKGARRVRGSVTQGSAARRKRRSTTPAGGQDTAEIRAWAKENGYEVSDRGRVSATVREAYVKAN
ncbi:MULTISPECIES: histone-like nucleoid-structuring protein Lsr2 [Streptomyces]|uniref:Lsr2 protein n=1 Tax=Streptomyces melanosporofaciens TaxID=67327 RepID=A0A1H4KSQ4_STRMJ|nr:Lsr2 family protein [Streptomyces melanosporofaciens]SEB61423.1 Lsr2 protein [Streptomyces melanosporofaciens]